jgi:hypothetical protein
LSRPQAARSMVIAICGIIPSIVVPLSLVGTFSVMYLGAQFRQGLFTPLELIAHGEPAGEIHSNDDDAGLRSSLEVA